MRTYTISRKTAPIAWDTVPVLPIDTPLWGTAAPITAQAQLCWDDKALHVRLSAVEEHIRAEINDPLGEPCEDSCLEFFFSPVPGDSRYFNVEFNPNGCIYLGFGSNRYDLVRLIPEEPSIIPQINRTADGWELMYSIPYAFIRQFIPEFNPVSGGSMRANFYKCGNQTVQKHYFSWNSVDVPTPDFHLSEYFGTLIFE